MRYCAPLKRPEKACRIVHYYSEWLYGSLQIARQMIHFLQSDLYKIQFSRLQNAFSLQFSITFPDPKWIGQFES